MAKFECPKCSGGSGHIKAFSHVMGGVCFKCGGKGYVEQKTKPAKPMLEWSVGATNAAKSHPQDHEAGVCVFPIFTIKASTEAAALKKATEKLSKGSAYIASSAFVRQAMQG